MRKTFNESTTQKKIKANHAALKKAPNYSAHSLNQSSKLLSQIVVNFIFHLNSMKYLYDAGKRLKRQNKKNLIKSRKITLFSRCNETINFKPHQIN